MLLELQVAHVPRTIGQPWATHRTDHGLQPPTISRQRQAEEDQELDTGVPCQWADWEDGPSAAPRTEEVTHHFWVIW